MNTKRSLVRAALGILCACGVVTMVIGVAHTPWGRPLLKLPLLSFLAARAGCPVGSIEPIAFEEVRRTRLRGEAGSISAKSHPALAFRLGESRRADVENWLATRHAKCEVGFVASVLECHEIQVTGEPAIAKLTLQFDEQQRLVSVDLFRSAATDTALVARFVTLGGELDREVGPATREVGPPDVLVLRRGQLGTAMRQHRYADYVAQVTLLKLGKRGLRLREQYGWLPPEARRDPA